MSGKPNCPRDERGWRIPRPRTKSAKIYELMLMGKTLGYIQNRLGGKKGTLAVLIWKIRNPEDANAAQAGR